MKFSQNKSRTKISDATDINKPWDKDNQAWWDWYVSLADNNKMEDTFITAEPLPRIKIPSTNEIISELAETYPLTNDQIVYFRKNGFIKLKNVFSSGAVLKLRSELVKQLKKEFSVDPDLSLIHI